MSPNTTSQTRDARWRERLARAPRILLCPLAGAPDHRRLNVYAARFDVGNSGARYRCAGCGFVYVAPLAQLDRRAIRDVLAHGSTPKADR